ncbi:hypothetical protein SCLCIDRAFT_25539 [Scleroderma citrinum Foug A]|uniref:Uncharacterized protein n=1 Tax=Scleroderma citrinum Foug A TaxID=1036808 RepID=A0A0C2ZJU7_9AGAM|nr:hypothetical protein SCLCIDRAFT_25539 [Scleroderma citrinum Foug A]
MLRIFRHIRKFLLSALKRYSPGRLLQYLLALCRAVFSRSKSKCSGQDSSHESLPKTPALAEGKESLAEEGIAVGHVISGSRTPAQVEAGLAHIEEIPLLCVCDHLLPIVHDVCIKSELSLKKSFRCTWTNLAGLLSKVFFLDQDGFIERSLAHTQIKDEVWSTGIEFV